MLLTASLDSFLVGFGIYFGIVWTRNLDESAGGHDSRSVFITYVVSLAVCYCVYALSRAVSTCQRLHEAFDQPGKAYKGLPSTMEDKCGAMGSNADCRPCATNTSSRTDDIEELAAGSMERTKEAFPCQARATGSQPKYKELVEALREASALREKSATADYQLARLFENLGQSIGLPK
jgi:hypothetical protein